ncbi:MAG: NYN domain-containing protein, partial [Pseudomonadota bacterium]
RLGRTVKDPGWYIGPKTTKLLLNGNKDLNSLSDDDLTFGLRQKGVDMRIGLDIASITLKKQAKTIVLVSGDSDFVPAAKLARREGAEFILDPMWRSVTGELFEHIDGMHSPLTRERLNDE